ncbi:MAG TPA: DUF2007 domain-containing protein [bacterium]|nr:DUF2007 domain-containing protein [bacterium]HPJ71504.1 DUF2007 domain-containing protein [bacterium]HPQ67136.1 DUF2007 domain-containing protein [bacterium]
MEEKEAIVFHGTAAEADLAQSYLRGHGITSWLKDETVGTLLPFYAAPGGVGAVKVMVAPADRDRARELLEARTDGNGEADAGDRG